MFDFQLRRTMLLLSRHSYLLPSHEFVHSPFPHLPGTSAAHAFLSQGRIKAKQDKEFADTHMSLQEFS